MFAAMRKLMLSIQIAVLLFGMLGHADMALKAKIDRRFMAVKSYGSVEALSAQLHASIRSRQIIDSTVRNKAMGLIEPVYADYRSLFPELMNNKDFPDFVVVKSTELMEVGVITDMPGGANFRRAVLMISDEFLNSKALSHEFRVSVIAHELAHLFLGHREVDTTILSVHPRADYQGEFEADKVAAALKHYMELSEIVGKRTAVELDGLPSGESQLNKAFSRLMGQIRKDGTGCFPEEKWKVIQQSLKTGFSVFEWDLLLNAPEQFARLNSQFREELFACAEKAEFGSELRGMFFKEHGVFPLTADQFLPKYIGSGYSLGGRAELETLLKLGSAVQETMRGLISGAQLKATFWKSFEDEADDYSVAIVKQMSIRYEPIVADLLGLFEDREPGITNKCQQAILSGGPIPIGYLSDPHHAPCFRVQRLIRLFESRGVSQGVSF